MSAARLGDAMAALYTLFTGSSALTGITITLGPLPSAAADPEFIVIGHDGTLEPEGSLSEITESGSFTTVFVAQGVPPLQEETGQVRVVAVSQTGDTTDLPGRVTEAERLLAACTDACAGVQSGDIVFDTATGGRLITRQAAQGCVAEFAFQVGYTAPW